ncbi:MAG: phosphate acyltransferase PlsX [Agitococcus sp.]|jgi:glycerol-3-phosphate acyltransferase PlsX|nr:phosphate acyltransferase PlsX [Moraxellaceae bacterium]MBP9216331.1 phosphate acyltransferase PlsX [Agitococcus sp.]
MAITLAVDAMGGDFGPRVTIPATLVILKNSPQLSVIFVGQESQIQPHLKNLSTDISTRISIVHTDEMVTMDDKIAVALRNKRQSSMRLAINLVHEKKADACISAGNTGALMAISRFVLKTHANIDRPAILAPLPTQTGQVYMLDLGANIDSEPQHLMQFASMGDVVARALAGIDKPRIGLLNIGEEEIKGNDLIKQTHQLLKLSTLNYIGYVEGDGIFKGEADVVICDGFVGNIALKTSEGVAKMMASFIKQEVSRNWFTKLTGAMAYPIWQGLKKKMNPSNYNGASLVGLTGIVIKSHGSADADSFAQAVKVAIKAVEQDIPSLIAANMA